MTVRRVAVVGAGAGGLAAALRLQQAGAEVHLFESAPGPGGMIRTDRAGEWTVERGASILADLPPEVATLLEPTGWREDGITLPPLGGRRYLVHKGKPLAVPVSTGEMLASPLLSLAGRVRMLKEPFVPRGEVREEESVASFVRRRFGDEVAARFFEPLVSGTSGADPEQVLVRYTMPTLAAQEERSGSILKARLRAARRSRGSAGTAEPLPQSWPGGLGTFVERLHRALTATSHFDTAVTSIDIVADRVVLTDARGGSASFEAAILALPAVALGALRFTPAVPDLAAVASMPHASPVIVALGYRRDQVTHPLDGFGLLVPASERRPVLSVQFTSSLFPERTPPGHVLLTVTLGGARQPGHLALSDEELVAMASREATDLLGITGAPVLRTVQRWPAGIPLAVSGHRARLDAALRVEQSAPRLALTGAWRTGTSLGEVMLGGLRAAERVVATG